MEQAAIRDASKSLTNSWIKTIVDEAYGGAGFWESPSGVVLDYWDEPYNCSVHNPRFGSLATDPGVLTLAAVVGS